MIVGLGNPGPAYRMTRHNIGAMVAQAVAAQAGIRAMRRAGLGRLGGQAVVVATPQTFMNASGRAVAALLTQWPVPPEHLLVVCDDVALPFGMVRLRPGGSDGGHRGLRSIGETLGHEAFPRLRVGIQGTPLPKALETYVLAPWTAVERQRLPAVVETAVTACQSWIQEGIETAMNRWNRKVRGA